jgi:hypothetical protein
MRAQGGTITRNRHQIVHPLHMAGALHIRGPLDCGWIYG